MERHAITALRDIHAGADLWLIAGGASMDYVAPSFFDGKLTLGVNHVHRRFRCDYLVVRSPLLAEAAVRSGAKVLMSEFAHERPRRGQNAAPGTAWYYSHRDRQWLEPVDLSVLGTDTIAVGASILIAALHLAAYMGARNIVLCGHDCGALDGRISFRDYYADEPPIDRDAKWRILERCEQQTIALRAALEKVYGCRVYSLNPFINFGLEGHRYQKAAQ